MLEVPQPPSIPIVYTPTNDRSADDLSTMATSCGPNASTLPRPHKGRSLSRGRVQVVDRRKQRTRPTSSLLLLSSETEGPKGGFTIEVFHRIIPQYDHRVVSANELVCHMVSGLLRPWRLAIHTELVRAWTNKPLFNIGHVQADLRSPSCIITDYTPLPSTTHETRGVAFTRAHSPVLMESLLGLSADSLVTSILRDYFRVPSGSQPLLTELPASPEVTFRHRWPQRKGSLESSSLRNEGEKNENNQLLPPISLIETELPSVEEAEKLHPLLMELDATPFLDMDQSHTPLNVDDVEVSIESLQHPTAAFYFLPQ
ncbi:unnamed protein product [Mesocestoides corti]|uniref:Uncharacterized protein n=1 Tax=Mesocestoides corti TaxID=53468 RepID=A0A0R3UBS0_MESCO|nr:unnamed protein product [Mesocestoides corti]